MTRPLTAAEVAECVAYANRVTRLPSGSRDWEVAARIVEDGDNGTAWGRAVLAKAAEIRARDAAQTVRGRTQIVNIRNEGMIARVHVLDEHGKPASTPVLLSLAAFPNIPDGATVEVTVRVIQENA